MSTMSTAPILIHQPRRLAVGAGTVTQVGDWAGKTSSTLVSACLLYPSDAADGLLCVDLGGRRIIKKNVTEPIT